MDYPTAFSSLLRVLMQIHDISPVELSETLNISSSTMMRILNDQTGNRSKREALLKLLQRSTLPFSAEECNRLRDALACEQFAAAPGSTMSLLMQQLFGQSGPHVKATVLQTNITLSELFERFPKNEPLSILCFNCCDAGAFSVLASVLNDQARNVTLQHYCCTDHAEFSPLELFALAGPLFFDRRYSCHVVSCDTHGADAHLFVPNMMIVAAGATEYLVLLRPGSVSLAYEYPKRLHPFERVMQQIERLRPPPQALFEREEADPSLKNRLFTSYLHCKNRVTVQLSSLPNPIFAPQLMRPACICAYADDACEHAANIVLGWHEYMLTQKKAGYFITDLYQTRRCFAVQPTSDLPLQLSAEQQCAFLRQMINMLKRNPNLHFHFLQEDFHLSHLQFTCYDGLGVSVATPEQQLLGNAFITSPELAELLSNFALSILIPFYTYDEEESLQILKAMLHEAEAAVESKGTDDLN